MTFSVKPEDYYGAQDSQSDWHLKEIKTVSIQKLVQECYFLKLRVFYFWSQGTNVNLEYN